LAWRALVSGADSADHESKRFSPFITLASGRPFNITPGKGANGDGLLNDRPAFAPSPGAAIIPRNYGSRPSLVAVNMRVGKRSFSGNPRTRNRATHFSWCFSVNASNILNHPN
jgi:hypothetical protein